MDTKVSQEDVERKSSETYKEDITKDSRRVRTEIDEMSVQEDHVHLFLHVPPKYAPARVVQIMKSKSGREVFEKYAELRKRLWAGEFWSAGYFVGSVVDKVTSELVKAYIRHQEEDGKPQQLRLRD